MSFEDILKQIVEPSGALGAALMGSDGIPIAEVAGAGATDPMDDDVSVLSVEFGRIVSECQKAADACSTGMLEEITVQMERATAILRRVDEETYLVVVLPPHANAGRARFDVRRNLLDVREQL